MPNCVSKYIAGILTFNFIQKWSQECKWHFSRIFWYFEWFLKVQFLFKTLWTWYRTENLKLTFPNKSFFLLLSTSILQFFNYSSPISMTLINCEHFFLHICQVIKYIPNSICEIALALISLIFNFKYNLSLLCDS